MLTGMPMYALSKFCVHKLKGFKVCMVDDSPPTWETDVKVVDIFNINMYS